MGTLDPVDSCWGGSCLLLATQCAPRAWGPAGPAGRDLETTQASTSFPLNLATGSGPEAALSHAQDAEGVTPRQVPWGPPCLWKLRGTVFPSLSGSPGDEWASLSTSTPGPSRSMDFGQLLCPSALHPSKIYQGSTPCQALCQDRGTQ